MSNSFEIPRIIAHQVPLSVGLSRQQYWSGLLFPLSGAIGVCVHVCMCAAYIRRRAYLHTREHLCGQTQADLSVSWCRGACVDIVPENTSTPIPPPDKPSVLFQHSDSHFTVP